MSTTKYLNAGLTIRATGDEPSITITTPTRDLMRDTIDPMGMDVASYLAGTRAVNLYHEHNRLPIGKTLTLAKSAQGIRATFKWLEANPEAATVRRVFEEGVLGASVEFVPEESKPNRAGGTHYVKSILTGWALTSNPANVQCVRMVKSLGLGQRDEIDVTAADVRAAFNSPAIRSWIAEEAARRVKWAMLPPDADVLTLDHEEEDVLRGLTRDDVLGALKEGLHAAAAAGVRRAVGAALGRID